MPTVDVAIVGAGIVGLSHAWEAARRGLSVALFERSARAEAASVRNFGMVWPIGQTRGVWYERAMCSRSKWLELRDEAGIWVEECGSLHAVHEADEEAVLREFAAAAPASGIACVWIDGAEAARRWPALNPDRLRGVLHSPAELCVDPRQSLRVIPEYLASKYGVQFYFNSPVSSIEMPLLRTARGETWNASRVFVCGGADFETLFPDVYAASGLKKCKLQMMATGPQPGGWRLGPHLAGGLTLGHYKSFEICPSLPKLKARIAAEMPDYLRFGIHVMASQNDQGEVIIGDSHEYGLDITPFDRAEIDKLILTYLHKMLRLPDATIARRWHGIYAKHPELVQFTAEPQPGCIVAASPGGAGMTLSFGCASAWWNHFERGTA